MWATLFGFTAVIAVALSLAAIAVDSAQGGKFRL
jgi:Tfp pilus assembly major pilin PilA